MLRFPRGHRFQIHQEPDRRQLRPQIIFSCVVLGLILSLGGCGGGDSIFHFKDPSGEPIKATVRTTLPLAYAASVAMASVTGAPPSNAAFIYNNCTTIPTNCAAVVTINDDDSALPLQFSSYGTITVYGYWTSPSDAILTVAFGSPAGSSLFPVHDISVFPVKKTANGLLIVYVSIDINASNGPIDPATLDATQINLAFLKLNITGSNEPSENINMDAWIINVDQTGTPSVFSDDTYSIIGGGQYMNMGSGSASVLQLAMANVVTGPSCALNPVAGVAVLNEVEASSSNMVAASAVLLFGTACDGNATVMVGSGNYLLSIGKSIPLNLNKL